MFARFGEYVFAPVSPICDGLQPIRVPFQLELTRPVNVNGQGVIRGKSDGNGVPVNGGAPIPPGCCAWAVVFPFLLGIWKRYIFLLRRVIVH